MYIVILPVHLLFCLMLFVKAIGRRSKRPLGADSAPALMPVAAFASCTGIFVTLSVLADTGMDLARSFPRTPAPDLVLMGGMAVAALMAGLPALSLHPGLRKKGDLMALLSGIAAFTALSGIVIWIRLAMRDR